MQVGFIGLGHMGQHMARHVAQAGHDVAAFDLRTEAVAQLTQTPRVRRATSVAEAAHVADVVFTSVPGPPEVEAVTTGRCANDWSLGFWQSSPGLAPRLGTSFFGSRRLRATPQGSSPWTSFADFL